MLDTCSTGTFISKKALAELQISGSPTKVAIKTINGTQHIDTSIIKDLIVSNLEGNNEISIQRSFSGGVHAILDYSPAPI